MWHCTLKIFNLCKIQGHCKKYRHFFSYFYFKKVITLIELQKHFQYIHRWCFLTNLCALYSVKSVRILWFFFKKLYIFVDNQINVRGIRGYSLLTIIHNGVYTRSFLFTSKSTFTEHVDESLQEKKFNFDRSLH